MPFKHRQTISNTNDTTFTPTFTSAKVFSEASDKIPGQSCFQICLKSLHLRFCHSTNTNHYGFLNSQGRICEQQPQKTATTQALVNTLPSRLYCFSIVLLCTAFSDCKGSENDLVNVISREVDLSDEITGN